MIMAHQERLKPDVQIDEINFAGGTDRRLRVAPAEARARIRPVDCCNILEKNGKPPASPTIPRLETAALLSLRHIALASARSAGNLVGSKTIQPVPHARIELDDVTNVWDWQIALSLV